MEQLSPLATRVFDEALAGFSDPEHHTLLTLMERVRANLSANMPEDGETHAEESLIDG